MKTVRATRLMLGLCLLIASALQPSFAQPAADAYPSQPVRIVVPFSAGSQTDILARAYAEKMQQAWQKDVIVENRPGIAGTASVAKAAPDGHTLLLTSNGHTIVQHLNKSLPFDPIKEFAAVAHVATSPGILVASPQSGITTIPQLIERAKREPGKLNYASAGLGSASSIGLELLKSKAGVDLVHVPYRGVPEGHTSIMRQDTVIFLTFYSAGGDLIQSKQLVAVAVTTADRLAVLPDVPTVQQSGLADYVYEPWFGLLAPAETDPAILDKINQTVGAISKRPDVSGTFTSLGVKLIASSRSDFAKLLASDATRFGPLFANAK